MTSETEKLRRLLDERGVEWAEYGDGYTLLRHGGREYTVQPNVCNRLIVTNLTPEQAIAATLGSCNCSDNCTNGERTNGACIPVLDSERDGMPYLNPRFVCSECGCQLTESRLGKVWQNFCPNCGRRIVEPTTNDVDAEVDA